MASAKCARTCCCSGPFKRHLKASPHGHGGREKVVIELKILYKSLECTLDKGLKQPQDYMDRCATSDGHLVIFDRRPEISWNEKIFHRKESFEGREIGVWGM